MYFLTEREKKTAIIDKCDVLIIGGGVAGVAAAVAARRLRCSVILVEQHAFLGGLATGGNILLWEGFEKRQSDIYTGIPLEIMRNLDDLKGAYHTQGHATPNSFVDPEILKYVLQGMITQAGVKLIGHLLAVNVVSENDYIRAVIFEGKSGRCAITAKTAVDATGDGDIFFLAGAPYKKSYLPISFSWTIGGVMLDTYRLDDRFNFVFLNLAKQIGAKVDKLQPLPHKGTLWCNGIYFGGRDPLNVQDLTEVNCEGRATAVKLLNLMRENIPGCEDCFLMHANCIPGVRTSRQLDGEYVLTKQDVENGNRFGDSVGILQTASSSGDKPRKKVIHFELPLRCLIPKKLQNLLVAGRCISVPPARGDFESPLEDIRLIAPCVVSGQAAGCVAAFSCIQNKPPLELPMDQLQRKLTDQSVSFAQS